jgi:hypothetical protein
MRIQDGDGRHLCSFCSLVLIQIKEFLRKSLLVLKGREANEGDKKVDSEPVFKVL